MHRCGLLLLMFCLSLQFIGCDGSAGGYSVNETDEKHYQRGQRLLREGRPGEALSAFLKVIEKRSDAAESHLEAGILYQQHVGDPIASIYHLRRYVELSPESREAEKARQLIETAKKDFARQLPGQPFDAAIDRIDLLEMLESMKEENEALKRELAALRQGLESAPQRVHAPATPSRTRTSVASSQTTVSPAPANPAPPPPASSRMSIYEVGPGDTLTQISTRVYGDGSRWQDIFQANRDQLPNPHALKVGLKLKIPE